MFQSYFSLIAFILCSSVVITAKHRHHHHHHRRKTTNAENKESNPIRDKRQLKVSEGAVFGDLTFPHSINKNIPSHVVDSKKVSTHPEGLWEYARHEHLAHLPELANEIGADSGERRQDTEKHVPHLENEYSHPHIHVVQNEAYGHMIEHHLPKSGHIHHGDTVPEAVAEHFGHAGHGHVVHYDLDHPAHEYLLARKEVNIPLLGHDIITDRYEVNDDDKVAKWSPWTEWSKCSVNCGKGFRKRSRECLDGQCVGKKKELSFCEGRHISCYIHVRMPGYPEDLYDLHQTIFHPLEDVTRVQRTFKAHVFHPHVKSTGMNEANFQAAGGQGSATNPLSNLFSKNLGNKKLKRVKRHTKKRSYQRGQNEGGQGSQLGDKYLPGLHSTVDTASLFGVRSNIFRDENNRLHIFEKPLLLRHKSIEIAKSYEKRSSKDQNLKKQIKKWKQHLQGKRLAKTLTDERSIFKVNNLKNVTNRVVFSGETTLYRKYLTSKFGDLGNLKRKRRTTTSDESSSEASHSLQIVEDIIKEPHLHAEKFTKGISREHKYNFLPLNEIPFHYDPEILIGEIPRKQHPHILMEYMPDLKVNNQTKKRQKRSIEKSVESLESNQLDGELNKQKRDIEHVLQQAVLHHDSEGQGEIHGHFHPYHQKARKYLMHNVNDKHAFEEHRKEFHPYSNRFFVDKGVHVENLDPKFTLQDSTEGDHPHERVPNEVFETTYRLTPRGPRMSAEASSNPHDDLKDVLFEEHASDEGFILEPTSHEIHEAHRIIDLHHMPHHPVDTHHEPHQILGRDFHDQRGKKRNTRDDHSQGSHTSSESGTDSLSGSSLDVGHIHEVEDQMKKIPHDADVHIKQVILHDPHPLIIDHFEVTRKPDAVPLGPYFGGETTPKMDESGWGPWTEWSTCSNNCGNGIRVRRRFCRAEEGPGATINGLVICVGAAQDINLCVGQDKQCTEDLYKEAKLLSSLPYKELLSARLNIVLIVIDVVLAIACACLIYYIVKYLLDKPAGGAAAKGHDETLEEEDEEEEDEERQAKATGYSSSAKNRAFYDDDDAFDEEVTFN